MSVRSVASSRKISGQRIDLTNIKSYTATNLSQYFDAYYSSTLTSSTWSDRQQVSNITFTGSPTVVRNDPYNSLVTFDGSTQYGTGLQTTNLANFSVYCWIKTTTVADGANPWTKPHITGVDTSGGGSRDWGLTLGLGYAGIWSGLQSGTDTNINPNTASSKVNDNLWYELAATSSYTNGSKLYVNQTQIGTSLGVNQNTEATYPFYIGKKNPATGGSESYGAFSCAVFMFYTAELTTTQLASNWNYFRGRFGR